MRKNSFILLLLLFAGGAGWAGTVSPQAPAWTMPEQEKLAFRIKWVGLTIGHITAEIKGIEEIRGRKAYRIEVVAKTTGVGARLFKVNDRFVSFLDAEKMHTLRHEAYRREGAYRKDSITDFDQVAHKASFRNLTTGKETIFVVPPGVQDPVTANYFLRTVPFNKGEGQIVKVAKNTMTFTVIYDVVGEQILSVPGKGRRTALLVRPMLQLRKKRSREGRMSAYISPDLGHDPYQFIIKAPVFTSVTAIRSQ